MACSTFSFYTWREPLTCGKPKEPVPFELLMTEAALSVSDSIFSSIAILYYLNRFSGPFVILIEMEKACGRDGRSREDPMDNTLRTCEAFCQSISK